MTIDAADAIDRADAQIPAVVITGRAIRVGREHKRRIARVVQRHRAGAAADVETVDVDVGARALCQIAADVERSVVAVGKDAGSSARSADIQRACVREFEDAVYAGGKRVDVVAGRAEIERAVTGELKSRYGNDARCRLCRPACGVDIEMAVGRGDCRVYPGLRVAVQEQRACARPGDWIDDGDDAFTGNSTCRTGIHRDEGGSEQILQRDDIQVRGAAIVREIDEGRSGGDVAIRRVRNIDVGRIQQQHAGLAM